MHEQNFVPQAHGGKEKSLQDQVLDSDTLCGRYSARSKKVRPLYQRVLSALIVEDETEEFEENNGGRITSFQYGGDYPSDAKYVSIDVEPRNMVRFEFEYEPISCTQTLKQHAVYNVSCNGNSTFSNGVDEPLPICTNASRISSFDCPYEKMCLEDKLVLELESIGLYLETVVSSSITIDCERK